MTIEKNPTRHYTAAEWAREQYKGIWDDCPYFRSMVERGEIPADFIGRRTVMVGGIHGCTLLTEGYHFTIEGGRDMKHFHAQHSFGVTFGMDIDATTPAYRAMKRNIREETVVGHFGIIVNILVCPYQYVAGIMRKAGWIVAEDHDFRCFQLDDGEEIFIEYPDGIHL